MYSNELICNILNYIDININSKFTVENLEKQFHYNRYYIMKLFKRELGITLFNYINKIRIYNSITEINKTNDLLLKVAINNGFYSLEYFSEIFKKEIGISPKKYKIMYSNRNIDFKTMSKILDIRYLKLKVNNYKSRLKKEELPVKKLSIFK